MNGFLLDENLPQRLRFTPSKPVRHVRELGVSLTDPEVWEIAKAEDLVVITKDADFSDRILVSEPPPKVVRLRIGNLRLAAFHTLLATRWPTIESLLEDHKLVTVYVDRFEAISSE